MVEEEYSEDPDLRARKEREGDVIEDNPNSGVVWKYTEFDNDGNGEIDDFMEKFHRAIMTVSFRGFRLCCSPAGRFFRECGRIDLTHAPGALR